MFTAVMLVTFVLVSLRLADAQQPAKIPWIGYLADSGSSPNQAFLQALRDLGYVEGKNIGFVYRMSEGKSERRPDLLAEMVRLKVDIIFADGTGPGLLPRKQLARFLL